MSLSQQNNRLIVLIFFLVVVLIGFIFLNYQVKKGREELFRANNLDISDLDSKECLQGNQTQRSRYCPSLIRDGNKALEAIKVNCPQLPEYKVSFLNTVYTCDGGDEIRTILNKLVRAMRR